MHVFIVKCSIKFCCNYISTVVVSMRFFVNASIRKPQVAVAARRGCLRAIHPMMYVLYVFGYVSMFLSLSLKMNGSYWPSAVA